MKKDLEEAIRATVAEAIESGDVLMISAGAQRLAAAHPEGGMTSREIAELLFRLGVAAKVPLEWDDPSPAETRDRVNDGR